MRDCSHRLIFLQSKRQKYNIQENEKNKKKSVLAEQEESWTEAEFLDEIRTKVLGVFPLAIHSHIY
jgi:hypothetical protein